METIVYILAIIMIVSSIALLIAVRIIKEQDERLTAEIKNNERLEKLYKELANGGERNGK